MIQAELTLHHMIVMEKSFLSYFPFSLNYLVGAWEGVTEAVHER